MKTDPLTTLENVAQAGGAEHLSETDSGEIRLAGCRAWIISDGVAGHLAITRGIAKTLRLEAEEKPIAPRALWRYLAPNGPGDPRVIRPLLDETLPEIVLGAGRQTVPVIRALKRAGAFTVIFQSPRATSSSADLIWVPAHDRLRGPNVIITLTPPHRFAPETLEALRRNMPAAIAALPQPRIALLLGGPGAGYQYDAAVIESFVARLAKIIDQAGSFLITPSRRTPPALAEAVNNATRHKPRILWNGIGENPYADFLACADIFIVTADSVNMSGEACATGRPVYVFTPHGGRDKFRRFHEALHHHGATRPLPEHPAPLAIWSYEPLNASEYVASEIERRWRSSLKTP